MKLKSYSTAPFLAIFVFFLTLCSNRLIATLDMGTDSFLLVSGLIELFSYLLPVLLYALLFGGISVKRMRLSPPSACSIPLFILLSVILLLGSGLISLLSVRLGITAPSEGSGSSLAANASGVLVLLVFAIIPAALEEVIFRGIIMPSFEECGTSTAIVATSLLFAAAHMSLESFPLYFFASVILSVACYATRSLMASVILHCLYNVFALTLGDFINGVASNLESFSLLFVVMLFLLWILVLIALGEASRVYGIYAERNMDSSYTDKKLFGAKYLSKAASVYFSLPYLMAILIFIAIVVFSMR